MRALLCAKRMFSRFSKPTIIWTNQILTKWPGLNGGRYSATLWCHAYATMHIYIYICIYYIYMCTHMCARTTYVMLCIYIYIYVCRIMSEFTFTCLKGIWTNFKCSICSVQMWSMEEIWFPHVRFLHPKCGGWVGACAMQAQDCSVSRRRRGAIERGRAAVRAWSEPRRFYWVLPAVTGFVFGWLGCFIWLLLPTVVYAP